MDNGSPQDQDGTENVPLLQIRRAGDTRLSARERFLKAKERLLKEELDRRDTNGTRSSSSYSLWVAICFVLNYSIGSGVLGLPNEYVNVGYTLGSILLLWIAILSYCTYRYVSNCSIRAEALESLIIHYRNISTNSNNEIQLDPLITNEFLVSGINPNYISNELHRMRISTLDLQRYYSLNKNKYQLNELIGIFCGKKVRWFYEICFFASQISGLWGFMALFGASLTKILPISGVSNTCNIENVWVVSDLTDESDEQCLRLYSIYVSLFWVWSVFITMIEFEHQKGLQIISTLARVSIIFLMAITSIGLIYSDYIYDGDNFVYTNESKPHIASGVSSFNLSGLLYFLSVASFAFTNQFCVRDVIQPLRQEDRPRQVELWGISMGILFGLYLLAGITVSLAFGDNVESPCTLAWSKFAGFWFTEDSDGYRPLWAEIVGWFIVLLPCIDIASSYPLNGITTTNTMGQTFLTERESNDHYWHLIMRFILCTMTAVLALLVWNFDFIVVLSGGLAMVALIAIPSYMEYKSRQVMTNIVVGNDEMAPNVRNDNNFQKEWIDSKFWYIAAAITSIVAFAGVVAVVVRQV